MKINENAKILVTGGCGFIGANFIHNILARENAPEIINLDALTYAGKKENLDGIKNSSNYKFVHGDICDRALIDKILREHNINMIVHFAAESHVDRSITGPAAFIETNFVGTFNLLEAARKFWQEKNLSESEYHFHHISTDEVYGTLKQDDPAFTETTPYAPNSPYSASKAGSDHLVRAYHHTYGLPVTTSNCSNNYGPFQHPEKFIPTVIYSCVNQKNIPVYGDGSNIRDWLYVVDHCKGIECVIENGIHGETYNIGGNNEWNNINICKKICLLMDEIRPLNTKHEELITFVKDRPGHDWRYAVDTKKIAAKLNWGPEETFETGLKKTVDFYFKLFNS